MEKYDPSKEKVVVIPFKDTEVGINTSAWLACIGSIPPPIHIQPWGFLGARVLASNETLPLPLWQFDFRHVQPLNSKFVERTVDRRPLPKILYEDLRKLGADLGFFMSLNEAVERANYSTAEQFQASAEEFSHVVFADLLATPARYRGKVVTVTGKLTVLRKVDTPRLAANRLGQELPHVYTGWVVPEAKSVSPYTVVFTTLPPEIPKESEKLDIDVTAHGYFLALVSYPPDKERPGKKQDIISPYLVGKTLTVNPIDRKPPTPVKDDGPTSAYYIAWTVGGIVGVALLVGLLNVWLRRGDRRTQSQLAEVRDRQNPFTIEPSEGPPLAEPPAWHEKTDDAAPEARPPGESPPSQNGDAPPSGGEAKP